MKKIFATIALAFASYAFAQETITVVNAQGPTQSMTPQVIRYVEEANKIQNRYRFVMEFKPGAFESIGIKHALENPGERIVTVTNSWVESIDRGFVNPNDVVPVFSFGDACWAIITNFGDSKQGLSSIANQNIKEITVGGPAIGGAAHLVALEIGKKYNVPVRYIVYRSNLEALANMAGDDRSVNMVMDRLSSYQAYASKNPKLQALALNCPERNPGFPLVKTVREQGIDAPYIWHFVLASNNMPAQRRKDIEEIFTQVTRQLGKVEIHAISDFVSPVFFNQRPQTHYERSLNTLHRYRKVYAEQIKAPN